MDARVLVVMGNDFGFEIIVAKNFNTANIQPFFIINKFFLYELLFLLKKCAKSVANW